MRRGGLGPGATVAGRLSAEGRGVVQAGAARAAGSGLGRRQPRGSPTGRAVGPMAFVALGVSGGIGAYKAVEVARLLQRRGHRVQAILTRAATRFVQPLTFEAITGAPVLT